MKTAIELVLCKNILHFSTFSMILNSYRGGNENELVREKKLLVTKFSR